MKLTVTTPMAVVLETDAAQSLRAEDESGGFGVLSGHADFLTALSASVMSWRDGAGTDHYIALRGGVLEVKNNGTEIVVATREAVCGDDLGQLQAQVLADYRRRQEEEKTAHTDAQRLYLSAIKYIFRHLRPDEGQTL